MTLPTPTPSTPLPGLLLAAAARLLSAPDASRSTSQVLGPAIDAMVAYAHGLQHASATLRPESFD